jgi:hypothetical protein
MNDMTAMSLDKLARTCLSHFAEEEAMLQETLEVLLAVRSALVHGDRDDLSVALASQEHTVRSVQTIHEKRMSVRRIMADLLGVPLRSVTLHLLAERVGGETGDGILDYRRRLTQLTAEVQRIHRANAALIHQSISLLERLLVQLTGGDDGGGRYGPMGVVDSGHGGSMIQARC